MSYDISVAVPCAPEGPQGVTGGTGPSPPAGGSVGGGEKVMCRCHKERVVPLTVISPLTVDLKLLSLKVRVVLKSRFSIILQLGCD